MYEDTRFGASAGDAESFSSCLCEETERGDGRRRAPRLRVPARSADQGWKLTGKRVQDRPDRAGAA